MIKLRERERGMGATEGGGSELRWIEGKERESKQSGRSMLFFVFFSFFFSFVVSERAKHVANELADVGGWIAGSGICVSSPNMVLILAFEPGKQKGRLMAPISPLDRLINPTGLREVCVWTAQRLPSSKYFLCLGIQTLPRSLWNEYPTFGHPDHLHTPPSRKARPSPQFDWDVLRIPTH